MQKGEVEREGRRERKGVTIIKCLHKKHFQQSSNKSTQSSPKNSCPLYHTKTPSLILTVLKHVS